MQASIITANRLDDGFVVYLTADGGWSARLADGALHDEAAAAARLAALPGEGAEAVVIGPYAIAVELDGGAPRPLGQRERLRTLGPSVRPDLGYQAAEE
jgi:Protein of unknown function (DUF2849)